MTDGSGFEYSFSPLRFLFLVGYRSCWNYLSRWRYHRLLENFSNPDCVPIFLITPDFACFFPWTHIIREVQYSFYLAVRRNQHLRTQRMWVPSSQNMGWRKLIPCCHHCCTMSDQSVLNIMLRLPGQYSNHYCPPWMSLITINNCGLFLWCQEDSSSLSSEDDLDGSIEKDSSKCVVILNDRRHFIVSMIASNELHAKFW